MRKWHLVFYDVREDERLRRVAKLMEGYGQRIQYSVFRCHLTPTELERLRWRLTQVADPVDSVIIFPLCEHCAGQAQGVHNAPPWPKKEPGFQIA
jgi:CRISPR-associated protein Cas2